MYCVNCGVRLADTEKVCPLCGTRVYHPDIQIPEGKPLYPGREPVLPVGKAGLMTVITMLFLLPMLITLLCDLQITGRITWSGYVVGGLFLAYEIFVLPLWFQRPNPVIFVPCSFGAIALFLLYVNFAVEGRWFLSFAFPVTGLVGMIVTAVAALFRYLRRGRLYVVGGAFVALGLAMPLVEFLLMFTFRLKRMFAWSVYPLVVLSLFGGLLILLAVLKPARESVERRFFL